VLRLAFHDIDDAALSAHPAVDPGRPFDRSQAEALADWVDALATDARARQVVVHCHAGISRSPAIALYIAHRYGVPLAWDSRFLPNRRVLRLLGEYAGLALEEIAP
jgi:predicted protein tyrosine phosphatase